jgi:hypothetical protein
MGVTFFLIAPIAHHILEPTEFDPPFETATFVGVPFALSDYGIQVLAIMRSNRLKEPRYGMMSVIVAQVYDRRRPTHKCQWQESYVARCFISAIL